jgi:hypothetical protein
MKIWTTLLLLTTSVSLFGQTSLVGKELEYAKARDRFANYFKTSEDNHYDQAILDKQDSDSLLVLEKMLREILKGASIDSISKNGKINLETLLPELGFGNLDGLVLNKNNVVRNSSQIFVTTKTLFFDYFKNQQIISLDSLTTGQLDNIFTSVFGGGEAHATTFQILKKSFTKYGQDYGCIGSFGQESEEEAAKAAPDCILVLVPNKSYIYISLEYLDTSIKELRECKSISDSLYALSHKYSQQYDISNPKDKSLIDKSVYLLESSYKQYCECYQKNLKDKVVFEKIKNQVINVMQYAEK